MEPLNVHMFSTDLEHQEPTVQTGGFIEQAEINTDLLEAIHELRKDIFQFKKLLFKAIVSDDTKHSPSDMKALMTFHATWLQCIAHWIALLDNKAVPAPNFVTENEEVQINLYESFQSITEVIVMLSKNESDGSTLVWNLLTKISTQNYPFDLGDPVENNTS
jgi:Mg2+ and Co2+ transporter CorA